VVCHAFVCCLIDWWILCSMRDKFVKTNFGLSLSITMKSHITPGAAPVATGALAARDWVNEPDLELFQQYSIRARTMIDIANIEATLPYVPRLTNVHVSVANYPLFLESPFSDTTSRPVLHHPMLPCRHDPRRRRDQPRHGCCRSEHSLYSERQPFVSRCLE
jgi:hypothetical protein